MGEGINRVTLMGNLGGDAELKSYPTGHRLKWNMATTRKWTDKQTGDKKQHTEWHRVVMWGKRAESLAPHLRKGTALLVEGRLETHSWDDNGIKKFMTEVRASNVIFAGRKQAPSSTGVDLRAVIEGHASPPPLPSAAS